MSPSIVHQAGIKMIAAAFACLLAVSCQNGQQDKAAAQQQPAAAANDSAAVSAMLDQWHAAAARADFDGYFKHFTPTAIFAGTDATERWNKQQFMDWARPFFSKGKAWAFTALERHVYFSKTGTMAWFDELLNTQMKICRGSGVAVKEDGVWKLEQYILSVTVPNDQLDSVIGIKTPVEDLLIKRLQRQ